MLHQLIQAFGDQNLSPHGICLSWRPILIWTHVVSDALIGTAYFSIPVVLGMFVIKRKDIAFSWMFWCFAVFILACGTTHFFAIWTLWVPDYGVEALIKAFTAIASVATAIALWPLLPQVLALPSPAQLRHANDLLVERVRERDAALLALQKAVAEREETEAMLRQSQKMEAIGQLTGGIAHDFNNLLGVIIGNLDRLSRLVPEPSKARLAISDALSGAEVAATLVQNMLAFARKQPLSPVVIAPDLLIKELSGLIQGALAPSGTLVTKFDADIWPILVDRNQLQSVILNLAVNARDAMTGSGTFTITVRNLQPSEREPAQIPATGEYVLLEFSDTGCGMSPSVLNRAVEPFFTTKSVGSGTGLGLSQVFGFVKQSDGHMTIDSTENVGSQIRIVLPRAQLPLLLEQTRTLV